MENMMKLNNDTLAILKSFSAINPSIYFRKGTELKTISPSKTILAKAKLSEEIASTFAIYDLSRFLGVVSLFENPSLELTDKFVKISSQGRSVQYTNCDPSTIVTPPDRQLDIGDADVTFDMKKEHFAEIMKALGVMSLPDFVVVGDGSTVYLRATDTKNPSSDRYDVEVGSTDKTFNVVFRTENMKIIPADYSVSISSKGISHFESEQVEYWIAVESSSTFE
jgi:hypothetical protein